MNYNYIDYSFTAAYLPNWIHRIQIFPRDIEGNAAGLSVEGTGDCAGDCNKDEDEFPSQPLASGSEATGYADLVTTASSKGDIGQSQSVISWKFTNPRWLSPTNEIGSYQARVRCDVGAVPGLNTTGCVFPESIPVMEYSLSGSVPELASHILRAQASGLPGSPASGAPLRRLIDEYVQGLNRNVACPNPGYLRPPGKSCDEYPFASTYQGAALSLGGPRTDLLFVFRTVI